MKFGENLYNLRKGQKLSQEKLAEKVGVSRQSVSKWETGDAYPEMNRILMLCEIFGCNLNDLVNDNIVDCDSLDEEVKMNVVKFEKEKQRKLKLVSRTLKILCVVFMAVLILGVIVGILGMVASPFIYKTISYVNGEANVNGFTFNLYADSSVANVELQKFLENASSTKILFAMEYISFSLVVALGILIYTMKKLSVLFGNIEKGSTPFVLDNLKLIKKSAISFVIYLCIPEFMGLIFEIVTKVNLDMEFELSKIFYCLLMILIYYIFDYGHQIQLDSKGRVYGEVNE